MKKLARRLAINVSVIFIAALILPGLSYSNDFKALFLAAVALAFVNIFIRPVLKLITLPVNLLTLGVFSWLINVLMLYLVTKLITGFEVSAFTFGGFESSGLSIPPMHIPLFWSYVVASFTIGFLSSLFEWVLD